MSIIIIIPTLNPNEKIIKLTKELFNLNFKNIVVIDDGSDNKFQYIFKELKNMGCLIYHNKKNYGKGKSIKQGIKFANEKFKNIEGYVTVDADYQHLPTDILQVANELARRKK